MYEEHLPVGGLPEPAGMIGEPTIGGWPDGYRYGVTRYADIILREAFPQRFHDLQETLEQFHIDIDELTRGGGSRATHTIRFEKGVEARGWGKRNITVASSPLIIDRAATQQQCADLPEYPPDTEGRLPHYNPSLPSHSPSPTAGNRHFPQAKVDLVGERW